MIGSNVLLRTIIIGGSLIGIPAAAVWGVHESGLHGDGQASKRTARVPAAQGSTASAIAVTGAATTVPYETKREFPVPSEFVTAGSKEPKQVSQLAESGIRDTSASGPGQGAPAELDLSPKEPTALAPAAESSTVGGLEERPRIPRTLVPAFWPGAALQVRQVEHAVAKSQPYEPAARGNQPIHFLSPATGTFEWSTATVAEIHAQFDKLGAAYLRMENWRADGVLKAVVAVPLEDAGDEHRFFEATGSNLDEVLGRLYNEVSRSGSTVEDSPVAGSPR